MYRMGIAYLWALVGIEHIVVLYTYDCVLVENVQVDIGIITRDVFERLYLNDLLPELHNVTDIADISV